MPLFASATHRAVLDELAVTGTKQGFPQFTVLRELREENVNHDADVDIEPVRPLEPAQSACLLECLARCGEASDACDDVGAV